ncbi:hypothetical protein [Schaalia sp. lx-260]|nr:hypothetical protein [Schaalia sp. lx-260]
MRSFTSFEGAYEGAARIAYEPARRSRTTLAAATCQQAYGN